MKRKDILLPLSALYCCILFYNQAAGINYLLFSLPLIPLFLMGNLHLLIKAKWWLAALSLVISSIAVSLYGNMLSVIANICSLLLFAAISIRPESSVPVAFVHAVYSSLTAATHPLYQFAQNKIWPTAAKTENEKTNKLLSIGLPLLVAIVFFFLYRAASQSFLQFTQNLPLQFISWEWLRFLLLSLLIAYALFHQRMIPLLYRNDLIHPNKINADSSTLGNNLSGTFIQSGFALFSLVNLLLLMVNLSDLNGLWIRREIPSGISHADFLHQGVWASMASIIAAAALILFYFNKRMHLDPRSKYLRLLVYLWILQNAFLLATALYKNLLYVQAYSLSYKRIGTFVYLALCFAGLFTTLIKVWQNRNGWFLWRSNALLCFLLLILSSLVNWDALITDFNLKKVNKTYTKEVDAAYLISLSDNELWRLYAYQKHPIWQSNFDYKLLRFLNKEIYADQRSWCYARKQCIIKLKERMKAEPIRELQLSFFDQPSADGLYFLSGIKKLDLNNSRVEDLSFLYHLDELEELRINDCPLTNYQPLFACQKLKVLEATALPAPIRSSLQKKFPQLQILPPLTSQNF